MNKLNQTIQQIKKIDYSTVKNKVIFVLAGDHGITEEGVSLYPKEVTAQMVYNFLNSGAGINVLANQAGARVVVCDMGVAEEIRNSKFEIRNFKNKKVGFGTRNFAKGPAMTKEEAIKSIENGMELFEEEFKNGIDIIGTGDMGIGNTTASTAITACLTGEPVENLTGAGTGLDRKGVTHKVQVIKDALKLNNPDRKDPIDVLSKVGGFEIGGIAGVIFAATARRVPVIIDGFISGAGALLACRLEPKVRDYLIPAHCSVEQGHKIILGSLDLKPLLDLNLRLGEGTGAALAMNLAEASIRILTQMATFQSAGVSEKTEKK